MNGGFLNILSKIKDIKISSIINGTNKTLTTVKKAIPLYKEIRPYFKKDKILKNDIFKRPIELDNEKEFNNNITFFD